MAQVTASLNAKAWKDLVHYHRASGAPCHLCGYPIRYDLPAPHRLSLSVDHIIARSAGGTNDPANTAPSHALCNSGRKDRDITPELRARLRLLVEAEMGITKAHEVTTSRDW